MQAPTPNMVYTMATIAATLIPAMSPADKPGASVLTACEAPASVCTVEAPSTSVLLAVLVLASGSG